MKVRASMCATCPFREGVDKKYSCLMQTLAGSSITERSRICHSTGSNNAFYRRTGKPEMLCRGARNFQLQFFYVIGFLEAATDSAWSKKCKELGIKQNQ